MAQSKESVAPEVHWRYWFNAFYESKLLNCLIELLKNSIDWGSSAVNVITNESHSELRLIDDGKGMNDANRRAFLAVGFSTASGEQSGLFGTGGRKIIFSFASHVRVCTAPEDEPGQVYTMEFAPDQLARAYAKLGEIDIVGPQKKTAKSWPHESHFGTDIVYTLKDPSSKAVYRGARLARMLSDRLHNVLVDGGMVLVDGQRLPPKQLAEGSRTYNYHLPADELPALGPVKLEFYRPAHKSIHEDLFLTGRNVGEVTFKTLYTLLNEVQRDLVPPLFLDYGVCGLITAGFLNGHVTERRDTYDADIANDERVTELLRLLGRVVPDVASHLKITLRSPQREDDQGQAELQAFVDRLRRRFNPSGEQPPGYNKPGGDGGKAGGRKPPAPPGGSGPRLTVSAPEFEPGEIIRLELKLPQGMSDEGWKFNTALALAKKQEETRTTLKLIAGDTPGTGFVHAVHPLRGEFARAEYRIVPERAFHLSAQGPVSVMLGSPFELRAINTDRLQGKLVWLLGEGSGQLEVSSNGHKARFTPDRVAQAQIVAFDEQQPTVSDRCDITVLPKRTQEPLLKIRDRFFEVRLWQFGDQPRYNKLVTIEPGGEGADAVHQLAFNEHAPAFKELCKAGTIQHLLLHNTALEWVRHFGGIPWDELRPQDLPSALDEWQNEAARLFRELVSD